MFERSLSLAAGVLLLTSAGWAGALVPAVGPTVPDVFTSTGWTVLATTGLVSLSSGPPVTFTGKGQAWVVSDTNNVFASGDLDFVYQFADSGPDLNERLTAYNFTGFAVDGGYVAGSGVAPSTVSLSTAGSVVGFQYIPTNLLAGQMTDLLVVETNAKTYVPGTYTVQDGSTVTTLAYAPALASPEPASVALIGAGLLGFSLIRRRSTKNKK